MLSLTFFAGVVVGLLMVVWVLALGVFFQRKCLAAQANAVTNGVPKGAVVAPVVAVPPTDENATTAAAALAA